MERTLLATALALALVAGGAAIASRAQDAPAGAKRACPSCGKLAKEPGATECPDDKSPLVRSDLVLLHMVIGELAEPSEKRSPGGHKNPFAGMVNADGAVRIEGLEKLVADWKELAAKTKLGRITLSEVQGTVQRGREAAAIGALKTIATAESIFREGDKDGNGVLDYGTLKQLADADLIDKVLGSGTKNGYVFEVAPSTTTADFLWWATAEPKDGRRSGGLYFFVNQSAVVFPGTKPFDVDKKTCDVPEAQKAGAGLVRPREELPPRGDTACPTCGKVAREESWRFCPVDGAALVRSDLVFFHMLVVELGELKDPPPGGHENPFRRVLGEGGAVKTDELEKLVSDYKAAAATVKFGRLALGPPGARREANEVAAVGALKTISTAQSIFREGDKDKNGVFDYGTLEQLARAKLVDEVLGGGTKNGYVFEVAPSTTTAEFLWWATATPQGKETGSLTFFANQSGVIFYGDAPFKVDKSTCNAPKDLTPYGR